MSTLPGTFVSRFLNSEQKNSPTPFYYYDLSVLRATLEALNKAIDKTGYHVHYALKANSNDRLLTLIREFGCGADCVSGNEILKALECGFSPKHIVFAGVGKSDLEIKTALEKEIFCFNCESLEELVVLNQFATAQNRIASVALRLNPNVNANTHHYITTGLEENKFGINLWELDEVLHQLSTLKNIALQGIHFHIGSQITDLSAFKSLCVRINEIQTWFESKHIRLQHINAGGGLGINYHEPDLHVIPDFNSYFSLFTNFLELRRGQQLHFELGRALVAQCGALVSKALFVKKGINTGFVILDAGMTELIRPALYQSYHKIENLTALEKGLEPNGKRYDVVGPICESSDCFGKSVQLPETHRGDLFMIRSTGAYGEVMASQYNLREKAPSVFSTTLR